MIADLPDKTEVKAYCALSRKQAALYQKTVEAFEKQLEESSDDMGRRGLVLATLMRLKQICNHAVARPRRRRALGERGKRQVLAACRDRRDHRQPPGENAGLHPVRRDHRSFER